MQRIGVADANGNWGQIACLFIQLHYLTLSTTIQIARIIEL